MIGTGIQAYRMRVTRAVGCPFCGAEPGHPCVYRNDSDPTLVVSDHEIEVGYVHDDRSFAYAQDPGVETALVDFEVGLDLASDMRREARRTATDSGTVLALNAIGEQLDALSRAAAWFVRTASSES